MIIMYSLAIALISIGLIGLILKNGTVSIVFCLQVIFGGVIVLFQTISKDLDNPNGVVFSYMFLACFAFTTIIYLVFSLRYNKQASSSKVDANINDIEWNDGK
jgi:NADH:ubiquinone oxidoreductase subunit K